MKNYFSHDEGARNDPKLIKLLMRLGQAGKGIYWDLIEMLYEQNGYLLLSECESYAFALRTECDTLLSVVRDFELFENDGVKFWSNSLLRRLEIRHSKSVKAAESAAKRWNNAKAMRTHNEGNANKGKESKVKEKKENNKPSILPGQAPDPNGPKKEDSFKRIEERFLAMFNRVTGRQFKRLNDKAQRQLKKLLTFKFKDGEFEKAVQTGFNDSKNWDNPVSFTPEYITRDQIFDKYLNAVNYKPTVAAGSGMGDIRAKIAAQQAKD